MLFNKVILSLGCSRNSDELSAVSGTEWKRVLKVDALMVRSVGGLMGALACQTLLCPPVKLSSALLTQHIHCSSSAPQRPYSPQPLPTHHTFFNVSSRQTRSREGERHAYVFCSSLLP